MQALNPVHVRRAEPAACAGRRPSRRLPRRRPRGFSLVELLVALLLLDVSLLALVGTSARVARTVAHAAARERAASIARARLERLTSAPCAGVERGESVTGPDVHEWWSVTPAAGATLLLADSVEVATSRGVQAIALRSRTAC